MPAFGSFGRRLLAPAAGVLAAGVRAGPGLVGYLGSSGALTTINLNGSVPGAWNATWDTGTLVIRANNLTIDHYRINASVVFTGANPTITNSIIHANAGDVFVAYHAVSSAGYFTVTDCTIIGTPNLATTPPGYQVNGISGDSGQVFRRNDVSGSGDGIHFVSGSPTASIISQNYIHDLSYVDDNDIAAGDPVDGQHCDGTQMFNNETTTGSYLFEHNYIAEVFSTRRVVAMNSASTFGPVGGTSLPISTGTINNNFFEGGAYHLRVNFKQTGVVVTNNDFGPTHATEFGPISFDEPAAVATWSNNRDSNGNLIPQP